MSGAQVNLPQRLGGADVQDGVGIRKAKTVKKSAQVAPSQSVRFGL
jgi:hypothetical protein